MRNNTNKFSHLELRSGEMSYALRSACNPEMVLTCPTANEVLRYSFSKSPCNIKTNEASKILSDIWSYFNCFQQIKIKGGKGKFECVWWSGFSYWIDWAITNVLIIMSIQKHSYSYEGYNRVQLQANLPE
jgi:hypothetical protein